MAIGFVGVILHAELNPGHPKHLLRKIATQDGAEKPFVFWKSIRPQGAIVQGESLGPEMEDHNGVLVVGGFGLGIFGRRARRWNDGMGAAETNAMTPDP